MDNLARNAILARQDGMSYGQWKALHPVTADGKEVKPWNKPHPRTRDVVCAYCGKVFTTHTKAKNRKYCDDLCRMQNQVDRNREYRQKYVNKKRRGEDHGET